MIMWIIIVLLLASGLVVFPQMRYRLFALFLLVVIGFVAGPPLLMALTRADHNRFRHLHLSPTKELLSEIQNDVREGDSNAALRKLETALSEWDDLETRGTNYSVQRILDTINKSSEQGVAGYPPQGVGSPER